MTLNRKPAPRAAADAATIAKYRNQYTTAELLRCALGMLDSAAEQQRGAKAFLHNNLTLEVIRDRVQKPTT